MVKILIEILGIVLITLTGLINYTFEGGFIIQLLLSILHWTTIFIFLDFRSWTNRIFAKSSGGEQ